MRDGGILQTSMPYMEWWCPPSQIIHLKKSPFKHLQSFQCNPTPYLRSTKSCHQSTKMPPASEYYCPHYRLQACTTFLTTDHVPVSVVHQLLMRQLCSGIMPGAQLSDHRSSCTDIADNSSPNCQRHCPSCPSDDRFTINQVLQEMRWAICHKEASDFFACYKEVWAVSLWMSKMML